MISNCNTFRHCVLEFVVQILPELSKNFDPHFTFQSLNAQFFDDFLLFFYFVSHFRMNYIRVWWYSINYVFFVNRFSFQSCRAISFLLSTCIIQPVINLKVLIFIWSFQLIFVVFDLWLFCSFFIQSWFYFFFFFCVNYEIRFPTNKSTFIFRFCIKTVFFY